MAKDQKSEKPKRTVATPAERVAKLEAELAAARERVHAKDNKLIAVLSERMDKRALKIEDLASKQAEDQVALDAARARVGAES
jgi:hypothetical protein